MKVGLCASTSVTAAAWLSSARTVRRRLKCRNERNPFFVLHITKDRLDSIGEEGGDEVKSARRIRPGQHTSYNGVGQRVAKPQGGANPSNPPSVQIVG